MSYTHTHTYKHTQSLIHSLATFRPVNQIFRTMIENKWGMSIYERDDDGGEEQDIAAAKIMSTLNNCRATEMCLDLVARGIEIPLQAEAIKLLVALLFKEGGAKDVQVSIYKHLSRPGSDLFFFHIRYLIQNLISWHRVHGVVILEEGQDPDLPEEIILIRCLQLMCEGHYQPNQDIMREQPNNQSQINLLDDFVSYIQILDTVRCRTSTNAALAVSAGWGWPGREGGAKARTHGTETERQKTAAMGLSRPSTSASTCMFAVYA